MLENEVYRGLNTNDWSNFLDGKTLINPELNLANLKNKRLLFVQGTSDNVIQSEHTEEYFKLLQNNGIDAKLIKIANAGLW